MSRRADCDVGTNNIYRPISILTESSWSYYKTRIIPETQFHLAFDRDDMRIQIPCQQLRTLQVTESRLGVADMAVRMTDTVAIIERITAIL